MAIYIPSEIATAAAIILVAVIYLVTRKSNSLSKEKPVIADSSLGAIKNQVVGSAIEKAASVMSPAAAHLNPPKSDPITRAQLAAHSGSGDPLIPIWVAIRGTVFDVSNKREVYGPGGGYSIFAGKDASRALAKSSLKAEDAIPDVTGLEPAEEKTLQGWYEFFEKRYNIVGKVVD